MLRLNESGRPGADCCGKRKATSGLRIDGLDEAGLLDCDMHESARWIKKRRVRRPLKRPLASCRAVGGIDLDQRAAVTGDVQTTRAMVDINPMCVRRGKWPVVHVAQV